MTNPIVKAARIACMMLPVAHSKANNAKAIEMYNP